MFRVFLLFVFFLFYSVPKEKWFNEFLRAPYTL